jgi:hypothetical protein
LLKDLKGVSLADTRTHEEPTFILPEGQWACDIAMMFLRTPIPSFESFGPHFTKFDVNIRPMPKEATPISYCEFSNLEDNTVVGTTTFIQRKTSKWRLREIEIQLLV